MTTDQDTDTIYLAILCAPDRYAYLLRHLPAFEGWLIKNQIILLYFRYYENDFEIHLSLKSTINREKLQELLSPVICNYLQIPLPQIHYHVKERSFDILIAKFNGTELKSLILQYYHQFIKQLIKAIVEDESHQLNFFEQGIIILLRAYSAFEFSISEIKAFTHYLGKAWSTSLFGFQDSYSHDSYLHTKKKINDSLLSKDIKKLVFSVVDLSLNGKYNVDFWVEHISTYKHLKSSIHSLKEQDKLYIPLFEFPKLQQYAIEKQEFEIWIVLKNYIDLLYSSLGISYLDRQVIVFGILKYFEVRK